MSMFDAFFNKGFKASKCKTLLKLTIPRIKLLRNRREIQIKQMRRDIAKLLETGQEATACIRVEHIIREDNMMAAHEILELFCELIAVRLPIIEAQRECPLDLKEAISSVCFSAPRCADLPELLQVLVLFSSKYGKEFVDSATELRPECGVNRQLIKLLSIRAPAPEVKLNLLKEIAKEHELDWDPSAMEAEFFKSTEDLLNGPIGKLPLHKEESHVPSKSATDQDLEEPSSPVAGFDPPDFPEVPKVPAWANADSAAAAPKVASPVQASAPPEYNDGSLNHAKGIENSIHETQLGSKCETSIDAMENKHFGPFVTPPSASFDSEKLSSKNEADVDLQDVLAAAQAAADTAESAAAAARAAASLAHMKIAELTKRKNDALPESSCDNPFYTHENCAGNSEGVKYEDHVVNHGSPEFTNLSSDTNRTGLGSYLSGDHVEQEPTHDRHRRLNLSDDDSYFSYPNLFTSEGPNVGSGPRYFTDISSSSHDVR